MTQSDEMIEIHIYGGVGILILVETSDTSIQCGRQYVNYCRDRGQTPALRVKRKDRFERDAEIEALLL
jgi:hypothetical protein